VALGLHLMAVTEELKPARAPRHSKQPRILLMLNLSGAALTARYDARLIA
jgi:hypothetical protein